MDETDISKVVARLRDPLGELLGHQNAIMRQENTGLDLDQDTQMFLRAADGDIEVYGELYRKYLPVVTDYLACFCSRHELLKDAASEVFLRIWQNRKSFCAASTFKTYLFGVASNVVREELKRLYRERTAENGLLEHHKGGSITAFISDSEMERAKVAQAIRRAICGLSRHQKQAIELVHLKSISVQKAAEQAGCSLEAFKGRLRRARMQLRAALSDTTQNCE